MYIHFETFCWEGNDFWKLLVAVPFAYYDLQSDTFARNNETAVLWNYSKLLKWDREGGGVSIVTGRFNWSVPSLESLLLNL